MIWCIDPGVLRYSIHFYVSNNSFLSAQTKKPQGIEAKEEVEPDLVINKKSNYGTKFKYFTFYVIILIKIVFFSSNLSLSFFFYAQHWDGYRYEDSFFLMQVFHQDVFSFNWMLRSG